MALNKELKSNMTGEPMGENPVPENKAQADPVLPEAETWETIPDPGPTAVPDPDPAAQAGKPADPQSAGDLTEVMATLKSLEKQLRTLNQNVADLESEFNLSKNPDYHVVLSRIDATRASLEKLITAAPAPAPAAANDQMQKLEEMFKALTEKQEKNERQLAQALRENANFQVQVRQGMQRDLDDLKEKVEGEQFNPLLKAIAEVYSEYYSIQAEECLTDKARRNLNALFGQLEDLLMEYDAETCVTKVGDVRQNRVSKVVGKIPTGEKEKHNTVAFSRMPGVVRNRVVLHQEFVDIYIYDPNLEPVEPEVPETESEAASGQVEPAAAPVEPEAIPEAAPAADAQPGEQPAPAAE